MNINISKMDQWDEVFADKEFVTEIIGMEKDEALKALCEKGYDFNDSDMAEMAALMQKLASMVNEDGELDENALETVAGGGRIGSHIASYFGGVGLGIGAVLVGAAILLGW